MDHPTTTLYRTVPFVAEVHRWNKAQQEILLPAIEDGSITLIGATTENPYHSLVGPLLSRCLLLRLEPLEPKEIRGLLELAVIDAERGMGALGVTLTDDALDHLVELSAGDARAALTALEAAVLLADAGETLIDGARVADAVQKRIVAYDRGDSHFDVVSAFIKSMRGSDPDASLFWLGRMIHAGEDPRFIVRRMRRRRGSPPAAFARRMRSPRPRGGSRPSSRRAGTGRCAGWPSGWGGADSLRRSGRRRAR